MFRRVKLYIKNLEINKKFLGSLIILQVIPMIALFVIVDSFLNQEMKSKTCEVNMEILKQTANGIENFASNAELFSLSIGTDLDVQEIIKMHNKKVSTEEIEKKRVDADFNVRMEAERRKNIRSITIFDEKDIIYQYGEHVIEEDRQCIPELRTLDGIPLWTEKNEAVYIKKDSSNNYIYLMRAIKDMYTFEIIAYERVAIEEESLREQYAGILNEHSTLAIVNENGTILSASESELIGMEIKDLNVGSLPESKEGYKILENKVLTWYTVKETNWKVIKIDEGVWLFRNNGIQSSLILSCILFTMIFAIVFMIIQRKTMILPIVKLSQAAKNFKEENFKMPIFSNSEDEIGELNRNLSKMMDYIQDLILNQYQQQIKQREIELKYMQSQINPHFLYNTLDSIRWMAVIEKQNDIAKQIEALADVFRHALSEGKDVIDLGQEIRHLESYILIQKRRFGDRICFEIIVDEGIEDCKVLKLILQPLVENAIEHGLEKKLDGGTVKVEIKMVNSVLQYCVSDDGVGVDEERIRHYLREKGQVYNAFALKNINERVQMKYGEEFGLTFHSKVMSGTAVTVRIPVIKGDEP